MFLQATQDRNPALITAAVNLHREGQIRPDTYILDLDAISYNGQVIKEAADQYGIKLFFMTKQLGRNPLVARRLGELGYDGAVAVDYKEAQLLASHNISLGNVGHLVQVPSQLVEEIVDYRPKAITVYSIEKVREISRAAGKTGIIQNILIRVIQDGDILYPGQYGGFYLSELEAAVREMNRLANVKIAGVTSFPCFLYDEKIQAMAATPNVGTVQQAARLLADLGAEIKEVNMPSATAAATIPLIAAAGGTHGEPGHGLLGTTPLHVHAGQPEIPAVVYVSEVSHNLDGYAYCYGGGHYRRSHMARALVGANPAAMKAIPVAAPSVESIDYYFRLGCRVPVGDTVVMAFRTQIFVTRSDVAVVAGIQSGNPHVLGIYDSQGRLLKEARR